MDVQQALLTRRTIPKYEPGPIDEEALREALTAAVHAPNHKLTNPWRFVRVGHETREKLLPIAWELKKAESPEARETIRKKFMNPAVLLVAAQIKTDDAFRAKEDYAACACAIQNLMLSLHGRGIGSMWGTGGPTRDQRTYDLLGIDRDKEEIIGFVWVGRAAAVPNPPKKTVHGVLPRISVSRDDRDRRSGIRIECRWGVKKGQDESFSTLR
ncbi:MAG: nitroreductase [Deltaproteobacteria bacterium]|nr:nitroreductase [Deltaproteobacteria bacterium]